MAVTPWGATLDILAGGGLEAIARSFLASQGSESVRQVVFGKYPSLGIGQKNYLVGLTNAFLAAGQKQQNSLFGLPIGLADVPINPGLGGVATATDRFRYTTYVGVSDPSGQDQGSIKVDVYSPIELPSANVAAAAEKQAAQWAAQSPTLAKYLSAHPLPTGVDIVGVQRAY